MTMIFQFQ